ncbi:MAG: hypothetical protein PQJ50_06370 [Spirochaetales bacterium]|nr:hypothetical protein [Spirochaetales bacterium]
MKRNLCGLGLMILLVTPLISLEVDLGDSLQPLMSSLTAEDFLGKDNLGLWLENEYYVYQLENLRIILSMNYYPFAVLTQKGEQNVFLVDYDGDSLFDITSQYLFIPPWVVNHYSTGENTKDQISEYLDNSSIAFQSDEAPGESETMLSNGRMLVETAADRDAEDRIFFYYEYLYNYLYSRKEYETAYYCLEDLFTALGSEINTTLLIYMVELAYRMNQMEQAKQINTMLLQNYPDFIPGQVYSYLLSEDSEEKENIKNILLNEHQNHWMVLDKVK